MRMDPIAEMLCREADPTLPADWEIYAMELIPSPSFTHLKVQGSVPSRFVRGKRKGEKKWCKPSQTFIFSITELTARRTQEASQ